MKTIRIFLAIALATATLFSQAQHYRKDGMPDMRFRENRSTYGSNYSIPTPTTIPSVRYQNGYLRTNGTFVQPHYKTDSSSTNWDNFSTRGNTNPYTGEIGSRARDFSIDALNYGAGKTINVGPRGGQYYINSNGNKTYVPKW